jgi:membrane protein implicated in regulation of membrane protease activity
MSSWISYSLVRLGIFGAVFVLLYTLGITWWVALIFATVVSLSASYIFLRSWREQMAQSLSRRAKGDKHNPASDEAAEDQD